jgi:diguanylate cyclase (GGDEF)-like protein/PAS domain S-box-containing protein
MVVSDATAVRPDSVPVAALDEVDLVEAAATLTRILGAIEEYVYVGEFLADDSYRVLFAGPCRERFLGMPIDQALTAVWADYVHPADMDLFNAAHESAHTTGRLEAEYRLIGADGQVRWVRDRGQLRTEGGRRLLDGSVLDVTAMKSTQAALESAKAAAQHAAQLDPLTGVANRRSLLSCAAALTDGPVGVLMLDIDHFKNINDLHGHAGGDAVLVALAARLRENTRDSDSVFRMGGEEFLLLLRGLTDDNALREAAETIRRRIEREPIMFGGETIEVTVSIGATRSESLAGEFDGLLTTADRVLYAAKRSGRNRVCLASEEHETQDDGISDTTTLRLARAMACVGAPVNSSSYSHLAEVAQLGTRIARQLACPPQQVLRCRLAGLVHEVGKTQMQARRQSQPDPSKATKTDDIKTHPTVGEAIINSVPDLRPIALIVRQQHERYDGTGSPDGLTGDSIALEARVLAAANAWSAMTGARADRQALSPADALPELDRLSGTMLDPLVVQALTTALGDTQEEPPIGQ